MLDLHSHILFGIDDGAATLEDSIALLELMKNDGIKSVIATPHFYPQDTDIDDFLLTAHNNYSILKKAAEERGLPKVYLGCELLYFSGLGQSNSLNKLCLNNSDYLLLELTDNVINDKLFSDLNTLIKQTGIIPIIAHIERYCKAKNYKKLLHFVAENSIPVQVNATAFLTVYFKRAIKKLIKLKIPIILGTDAHSITTRPPKINDALTVIEKRYGAEFKKRIIRNSAIISKKITGK